MTSTRINFAVMWQTISRHRSRMVQRYLSAGMMDYAIRMQNDAADAHRIMTYYLRRLQEGL